MTRASRIDRSERGITIVFIALTLVAMLTVSALAIDLGQAYTSRRQMQNASDGASLAATRQLMKVRNMLTGAFLDPTNTVQAAAVTTATANGADVAQVTCSIIRRDQSVIAPCSPSSGWILDAVVGGPAGVKVKAAVTNQAAFGKVISNNSLSPSTTAAATIQPLVSSKGAPFLVCGVGDVARDMPPGLGNINLLVSGAINPLAVGHTYNIQGSGSSIATCGIESAFDGKSANDGTPIDIPSWQTGTNGNGNDHSIYDTVAGATPCAGGTFSNCDLVLPIADTGTTGYQLHVVVLGVFHITGNGSGNPKYQGTLLTATAPVTRGEGDPLHICSPGQACVIKLVS